MLSINASIANGFTMSSRAAQAVDVERSGLNLAGTAVTDAGLPTLAAMPNLQRLRLERTKVTDAGMTHLAKLAKLEYLNLYGTEITEAGLTPLQNLPVLRQVYVWRTKVDPAAAKAFAESMVDQTKVDGWKQQIAELQAQIKAEQVEVVHGVLAAIHPATAPAAPAPVVAAAARRRRTALLLHRQPRHRRPRDNHGCRAGCPHPATAAVAGPHRLPPSLASPRRDKLSTSKATLASFCCENAEGVQLIPRSQGKIK